MPKEVLGVVRVTDHALVKFRDGRGNEGTRLCVKANGKWGSVFGSEHEVTRIRPLAKWLEDAVEEGLTNSMEMVEEVDDEN